MSQTFVGKGNNEVEQGLAEKLAAGMGGPELFASMLASAGSLLDAHGAPDYVKQALAGLGEAVTKWVVESQPKPAAEPSHDAA